MALKIRHILEYAFLRAVLAAVDVLPFAAAERLAAAAAGLIYAVAGTRRETAIANIKRSGITRDDAVAGRIARESFRHFILMVVESIKADRFFDAGNWQSKVDLDIPAETMRLLKEPGKGILLVSGHLGNWEVAAQLLSHVKPVTAISREMNNPYVDRLIARRKARSGLTLTPKHGADGMRFLKVLKNGEVLALLNDQHARDRGMQVDFFGEPASTHTALATLHYITGAPILFGYCVRTGLMKFKLKALEPMMFAATGDRRRDVRIVLERLNGELETAIREYPEQYLWAHRRWKVRPA